MTTSLRSILLLALLAGAVIGIAPADADREARNDQKPSPRRAEPAALVKTDDPLSPPTWALLQRQ